MRHLAACAVLALLAFVGAARAADWIEPPASAASFTPLAPRPCPLLRREFTLDAPMFRATVRVVGLGHFELHCNGAVVGDSLVNQAWSQYDKSLYVQTFDVTDLVRPRENCFGVLLGNSFWRVEPANHEKRFVKTDAMPDFSKGHAHLLWLEARIETADGVVMISSDGAWRSIDGPLTFSNIYAGEDFDARRVPRGWDMPGFDDSAWPRATVLSPEAAPSGALIDSIGPAIKPFEIFAPSETKQPADGVLTCVFPQNCSALLRFTLEGQSGAVVRFKPCEYMDETGRVKFTYTWGTGKDIWHDYTLRGGGPESHQTLFCFEGAQYVEVEGVVRPGAPNPFALPVLRALELVHVRAACPAVGVFDSSSDLQNGAHRLIDWSIRSNMSHVPMDCPHREKNGWLEQDWHMARALSYRYDTSAWMKKLCRDIGDTQLPDGHIPTNSPNYLVGVPPHGYWNEAPEWGIAGVLVPWHLYEWYGDSAALATSFDSMKRYIDYLAGQAKDGAITSNLGDWYDYGHGKGDGPSRWTPNEVSATAIWALGAATLARSAEVIGRSEDARTYRAMFERIRGDFQRRFYDAAKKSVTNHGSCQAAHAAALCADLVPEGDRGAVLEAIVRDLEARGHQQTVGEVLQVFLIRALAEGGRNDVLHRVYAREERGGYGYMVRQGMTTLPESWDARPGTGNSMNHMMLGHLVEWHFAHVAGIRQAPGDIGWKSVLIAPSPSPETGVMRARASFQAPTGTIHSAWSVRGDRFTLGVVLPSGVEGVAKMPDGTEHALVSGVMRLECELRR